jgi:hypothetical protein
MNFIINMFTGMFRSRVAAAQARAEGIIRANTVGKVQQKVMAATNVMDRKVNAAQDKLAGRDKKGGPKAPPPPSAPGAPAAAPAPGALKVKGPAGSGGGATAADFDDAPAPSGPPGAPRPRSAVAAEEAAASGDKTSAIDISSMKGPNRDLVGWFVALNGSQKGDDFRLYNGKNVLGTSADCDVVITDPYLSAKHCTLRHEEGTYTLIDLDSTNGTFVNQKKITKMELIDNDTVRLGRTDFKFKSLA